MESTSSACSNSLEFARRNRRLAPKAIGLLITPVIALLAVALLHVLSWLDPKLRRNLDRTDRMHKVLQIVSVVFVAFLAAIFAVQIAAALDRTVPAARVLNAGVLIFLAILGNYLGTLRPNYFIGIRTPWTLENPQTWRATHRLGGRLMFFGSLFLLVLEFLISERASGVLLLTFVLLLALWSLVYSWHHYRTHGIARKTL